MRSRSYLEHPVYVDFSVLFENIDCYLHTLLSFCFAVSIKPLLNVEEHLVKACISA